MDSATTAPDRPSNEKGSAASRYEELAVERQPYLQRARRAAELTIPSLMPPEGSHGGSNLYQPYQSTGADGVNNLAAKLLLVLFPPGVPFFRQKIADKVLDQLREADAKAVEDIESALGRTEQAVVDRMEVKGARKDNYEALQHLIVTGNGLIHVDKEGGEKFFPLDRYVVCRDLDGNVLEIITKENVHKDALPPDLLEVVERHAASEQGKPSRKEVEVYTWVKRTQRGWSVHQEVCGEKVGKPGYYPLDKNAWIPLRWTKVAGEHYGRGRCEEYIGDLQSLEYATKSIIDFAKAVSKIVALVRFGAETDKEELARAKSGDVLEGDAKDVTFLMIEKGQDFQVCKAVADEVKQRLERAFLNATSIQRQAERVTAEEIRVMAAELEQGLGGVYSILSEEFQRPLVTRILHVMAQSGDLPKLPDKAVKLQIVAGLDGLGRNSDMQRLSALIQDVGAQFGPEAVAQHVNVGNYIQRRANALGIDIKGLIRSDEEIQAQQQQQQMAELGGKLGGPAIKAMSDQAIADKQLQQQSASPPAA